MGRCGAWGVLGRYLSPAFLSWGGILLAEGAIWFLGASSSCWGEGASGAVIASAWEVVSKALI